MARVRSRVEKDSDTPAPHPFLFFFSYFSLLEALEPTYTPIRSPGTLAPQQETQASPRPLQVSPPQSSCAPGTGSPRSTPPSSWCPSQPRPSLLQVHSMPQQHPEVLRVEGEGGGGPDHFLPSLPPLTSQALAVLTGGHAPRRVQGPGATAAGGEPGTAAG